MIIENEFKNKSRKAQTLNKIDTLIHLNFICIIKEIISTVVPNKAEGGAIITAICLRRPTLEKFTLACGDQGEGASCRPGFNRKRVAQPCHPRGNGFTNCVVCNVLRNKAEVVPVGEQDSKCQHMGDCHWYDVRSRSPVSWMDMIASAINCLPHLQLPGGAPAGIL